MTEIERQQPTPAAIGRGATVRNNLDDLPPARPRQRNWILALAGAVALLALVFFGWRWWDSRRFATTDDAYVGGDMIPVLSRVSGYVQAVNVQENESVKSGQPLVEVDPSELQQRLAQAQAELEAAQAGAGGVGLAGAQAQAARAKAAAARADIAQAEANEQQARADVARLRPLAEQQIVSRQQFETTEANARAAKARLDAARENATAAEAQSSAAQANVGGAQSRVNAAQAAVEQVRLQLAYTHIAAPAAGVVAKKSVQVGQLVSPGQALMTVVPLENVWVTANLKETQLKGVDPGDPVEIKVDAYPGLTFQGKVESISPSTGAQFSLLPPENATGNFTKVVQRVPVRVRLSGNNPPAELRPGMSSKVRIEKRP
jgi:membrane fusion protein (multidrug efflux system)